MVLNLGVPKGFSFGTGHFRGNPQRVTESGEIEQLEEYMLMSSICSSSTDMIDSTKFRSRAFLWHVVHFRMDFNLCTFTYHSPADRKALTSQKQP